MRREFDWLYSTAARDGLVLSSQKYVSYLFLGISITSIHIIYIGSLDRLLTKLVN